MKKILILTSATNQASFDSVDEFSKLLEAGLEPKTKVIFRTYREILFHLETNNFRLVESVTGKDLASFDFVLFKTFYKYLEESASIAEYLRMAKIPYVCSELEDYLSFSKLTEYVRLARAGLPIPRSFYAHKDLLAKQYEYLADWLGVPFICKSTFGKKGEKNFLIDSSQKFEQALGSSEDEFICQKFIPNDYDLRILVLGGKVSLILKRQRTDKNTHLNNTAQGADASLVETKDLPKNVLSMALKASQVFKREIAGVDVMFNSQTGEPYIIEINASPALNTGAFPEQKMAVLTELVQGYLTD